MTRAFGLQVQIPPGQAPSTAQRQAQGKDPLGALPPALGLSSGSQLLLPASRQLRVQKAEGQQGWAEAWRVEGKRPRLEKTPASGA